MNSQIPDGGSSLDRRRFLGAGALVVGGVASAGLLSACGVKGSPNASASSVKPKYGGTIAIGVLGNGAADTLDYANADSAADLTRANALYDKLFDVTPDYKVYPKLVDEYESNADASVWTLRLKEGVEFHNGKTLTPEDVIYSLQRILNPKNAIRSAGRLGYINPNAIKIIDKRTLQLTLTRPAAILPEGLAAKAQIVPVGWNPNAPVGTGPFKFGTFTPGQQSHFPKNPNYFINGRPYADAVDIINFQDNTSCINALVSGQIHLAGGTDPKLIKIVQAHSDCKVSAYPTAQWNAMTMRTDTGPFADVRVRQAMKLIMNRPQMLEVSLAGQGTISNDIYGIQDADYDHSIPQRVQDLDKAASLLRAAGAENLQAQITTSDVSPGMNESAIAFAQMAKKVGVDIKVNVVDGNTLYGDNYGNWTFSTNVYLPASYLAYAGQVDGPAAAVNASHFSNARFSKLYYEAIAEPDAAKRAPLVHEMQRIQYDDGGLMIPAYCNNVDASRGLGGLTTGMAANSPYLVADMFLL